MSSAAAAPGAGPQRRGSPIVLLFAVLALSVAWCGLCAMGTWAVVGLLARVGDVPALARTVVSDAATAAADSVTPSGTSDPGANGGNSGTDPAVTGGGSANGPGATGGITGSARGGRLLLPGESPGTLDPALVGDVTSAEYVYEVFSGLVTLTPALEVVPDLAERWDTSADGTVYTFTLRSDAVFHDGSPVTAAEVAYAIERACDPATASVVAGTYLGDIVGCADKLAGRATSVAGARALDDRHFALTIDAPKAYFLAKLTYPTAFVVDPRQVTQGADWWREPNGTGPFRLAEYVDDVRLVLERHDAYYGEPAHLDAVEFDLRPIDALTRYENGELDAAPVGGADLERVTDPLNPLSHEVMQASGDLAVSYVGFNVTAAAVRRRQCAPRVQPRGRQGPAHACRAGRRRAGGRHHTPAGHARLRSNAPTLRVRSGGRQGGTGRVALRRAAGLLPLTLDVAGEGGEAPVAEVLADMWRDALGVDVTVEQTPWATYQSELDRGA